MKIIIDKRLTLHGIREGYYQEWIEILKRIGIPFTYAGATSNNTYIFFLNDDRERLTINLSDEDMKVFLNTIEAHSKLPIKYIYLGNMRFEAVIG